MVIQIYNLHFKKKSTCIYNNHICKIMAKHVESYHLNSNMHFCAGPICPMLKTPSSLCFVSEAGTRPRNYRPHQGENKRGMANRGQCVTASYFVPESRLKFFLYFENWFRTDCGLRYFPVAVIKHHDPATYRHNDPATYRRTLFELRFQRGNRPAGSRCVRGAGS